MLCSKPPISISGVESLSCSIVGKRLCKTPHEFVGKSRRGANHCIHAQERLGQACVYEGRFSFNPMFVRAPLALRACFIKSVAISNVRHAGNDRMLVMSNS